MTKNTLRNEQKKREFYDYLRGAKGFTESSVYDFADSISQWQVFTNDEDFGSFNKTRALEFRKWLKERPSNTESGQISLSTQYSYLRRVKKFFTWLADQPNYKAKISKTDVDYFRLSKKDIRVATTGSQRKKPSFEDARDILESIAINSDVDRRDQALISLTLITGMRVSAISTLKIKSFDPETNLIDQNPADGVKTKNSKHILSTFFPIGWNEPKQYFLEWFSYLKTKGFTENDPLFPATQSGFMEGSKKELTGLVSREFWSSSEGVRKVFKKRCEEANIPYFNPHSFRHLIVQLMSKTRLTEEQKKAVSLNLGHSNTATTFGAYGYGNMSQEDAMSIVQRIEVLEGNGTTTFSVTEEEKALLEKVLKRLL